MSGEALFWGFVGCSIFSIVLALYGLCLDQPLRVTIREACQFLGACFVLLMSCGFVASLYFVIVGCLLSPFVVAAYFLLRMFS